MSGDRLCSLLDRFRPGYSLPQEFFTANDVFEAHLTKV